MAQYTQLWRSNINAVPNVFAIYSLKHEPTAMVYLASTSLLRDKLRWWVSVLSENGSAALPAKVTRLLAAYGRKPLDWSYAIIDTTKPERFNPHAKGDDRPEAPLIKRLYETAPHLLLNAAPEDPAAKAFAPLRVTSRIGMQPRSYLAIRLGLKRGPKTETMPPHSWRVDPTELKPACHPMVPFALYLYRAMTAQKIVNPSREAIAALYQEWLKHVPASEREAVGNEVPYTIDAAVGMATPRGYELT